MFTLLLHAIIGYALGSVPFGLLWTRLLGCPDPRGGGSGNIGATNVLRTGGRTAGALTLLCDAAKGAAAAALGGPIGAFGAFIGHVFPIWLRGRGGKGVAVFLGGVLVLHPLFGAGLLLLWAVAYGVSKRSSVGALSAAATSVLYFSPFSFGGATALALIWTHRSNIARLYRGLEPTTQVTRKKS